MMTRKEIYLMVLEAEIRSQKLYKAMAKSFRRPENSAVFQQLVVLEKNHEEKVRAAFLQEFPNADAYPDPVLEPEFKKLDYSDPAVVLEYAIEREDVARDHYLDLAEGTQDGQLKMMLKTFAAEEEQHKELLQEQLQSLQGAYTWYDPSELTGFMED
ncbi:MAG: ferritin family protein [Candidatus Cloacimonetes bacterium]|nr:ferritin family protein [Candidatus Cloacimonadota bacterium]